MNGALFALGSSIWMNPHASLFHTVAIDGLADVAAHRVALVSMHMFTPEMVQDRRRRRVPYPERVIKRPPSASSRPAPQIKRLVGGTVQQYVRQSTSRPTYHQENGFRSGTPVEAMSSTLRVTRVKPWTLAVAARSPSIRGGGSGILNSAQASPIGSSMGRTRSPSLVRI